MLLRLWLVACLLLVSAHGAWAGADPAFSDTGPDAAAYGAGESYPVSLWQALAARYAE